MTTNVHRVALDLPLRGGRDYAHGTDCYSAASAAAMALSAGGMPSDFKLSFHGLLRRQGLLEVGAREMMAPAAGEKPTAEFSFLSGGVRFVGRITPTNEALTRRIAWDEDAIARNCSFDGSRANVRIEQGQSPIEGLVATTKVLHYRIFPVSGGRWMFTRLELPALLPATAHTISLECKHNFNNRLTKSELSVDGAMTGSIYFSLMQR